MAIGLLDIVPKLLRRLSTFSAEKKAGIVADRFPEFLKARPDVCYETSFLAQGPTAAMHRRLDEFVSKQSVFTVGAGDVVFQEAGSVTVGKNGKPAKW
jgi:hypothetical protein